MEAQHEVLDWLMCRLAERGAASAPKSELSQLLRQLQSQTEQHFVEEEQYMRDLAHPKLDTHQIIHRELLSMLQRHVAEFDASDGRVSPKLLGFLKYFLGTHLQGMDRHLARYSRSLRRPSSGLRKVQVPGEPVASMPARAASQGAAAEVGGRAQPQRTVGDSSGRGPSAGGPREPTS
jgi:hemerythrin-like metal-binding protein